MKIVSIVKGIFIVFIPFIIIGILLAVGNYFFGHSASDILGTWNAQDTNDVNKIIKISKNKLEIDGQIVSVNQNLSGTFYKSEENIVRDNQEIHYYGFSTKEHNSFSIVFPDKDKNIAVLIESNSNDTPLQGKMLYAMNKREHPDYKKYVAKYLK